MPNQSFLKKPAARKYPDASNPSAKPVSGRVKKAVRLTPRVTGKKMPNAQKPVKSPMSLPERAGRANKAKVMHRAGQKGPVLYKSAGGNTKKR